MSILYVIAISGKRTFTEERLYLRRVRRNTLRNAQCERTALASAAASTDEREDVEGADEAGDAERTHDAFTVRDVRASTQVQPFGTRRATRKCTHK